MKRFHGFMPHPTIQPSALTQVNSTLAAARVLSALQHVPQRLLRRKRQKLLGGPVDSSRCDGHGDFKGNLEK